MSKKISEMNYLEKYEHFKRGIIELVRLNFNGKAHMLEPIVFLGVKHDVLNHMLKNKKEGQKLEPFDSGCDCEGCKANREMAKNMDPEAVADKIHIIPIEISNELSAGNQLSEILGPAVMDTTKKMINEKVRKAIDRLNEVAYGAVQYTANITEAYILEHKMSEKENSLRNLDKDKIGEDIEKELKDCGGVKNHPNAKEKVVIIFETLNSTEIVTFDILRNEDSNYQELLNERSGEPTHEPATGGYLTGLIHKEQNVN